MNMNHKILLASTAILSFTSLMASGKLNPKVGILPSGMSRMPLPIP